MLLDTDFEITMVNIVKKPHNKLKQFTRELEFIKKNKLENLKT